MEDLAVKKQNATTKNVTEYQSEWLPRRARDFNQEAVIIFQCKDDCTTLLDVAHIKEMMRFTAHAVDDPLWAQVCSRDGDVVDSVHCGADAYRNLTARIEPMINMLSDLAIQSGISSFAKDREKFDQMRRALDKGFKPSHPYSKTALASLRPANPVFESKWILSNESGTPTYYEEEMSHLSDKEMRAKYEAFYWNMYYKADGFDSDLITVRILSEDLFNSYQDFAVKSDT